MGINTPRYSPLASSLIHSLSLTPFVLLLSNHSFPVRLIELADFLFLDLYYLYLYIRYEQVGRFSP